MKILLPRKDDCIYRHRVEYQNNVYPCWLTYEIFPNTSRYRNLLLFKGTKSVLNENELIEYNNLYSRLINEASGNIASSKNIVNKIAEGVLSLPNVRLTIHRFGPVPVYVLPEEYNLSIRGKTFTVNLAMYPNLPRNSFSKLGREEYIKNQVEFINTLNLKTSLIFNRYLEDVGEFFYDIEYHLGLEDVFRRAHDVEKTLGESIKTKYEACLPQISYFKAYKEDKLNDHSARFLCNFFEEKSEIILTARYARSYALYFINELYKLLGITSITEHYHDEFKLIKNDFDKRLYDGFYKDCTRDNLDNLIILRNVLMAYNSKDYQILNSIKSEIKWVSQFVGFAKFISKLLNETDKFSLKPEISRIFISHQHDITVTELLKKQIDNWLKNTNNLSTTSLFFHSSGGPEIRNSIRRLIWLSDSLNTIIPNKSIPLNHTVEKPYYWLGIETEHALLLEKDVMFFVEENTDLKKIIEAFNSLNIDDLLAQHSNIPFSDRKDDLINSLSDKVFSNFSIRNFSLDFNNIDPRINEVMQRITNTIILQRAERTISGFLGQFTPEARRTAIRVQNLVPLPNKKPISWISRELYNRFPDDYNNEGDAKRIFKASWLQFRERSMNIKENNFRLIEIFDRRYYSGQIALMIKNFLPISYKKHVNEIFQRISNRIMSTF